MSDKSIIGLSRLMALRRELDTIAHNVANQGTTGFKARRVLFREYLKPNRASEDASKLEPRHTLVHAHASFSDLSSGALKPTGSPLNVAVIGDAFFVVRTNEGERYTRDGAFMLDRAGRLVTATGAQVLTTDGALALSPQDGEAAISADGTVLAAGAPRGRLRLVRFADPQHLRPEGANLLTTDQAPAEVPLGEVRLAVGVLESSNVRPVVEMSRLVEVTRAYELVASTIMKEGDNSKLARLAGL